VDGALESQLGGRAEITRLTRICRSRASTAACPQPEVPIVGDATPTAGGFVDEGTGVVESKVGGRSGRLLRRIRISRTAAGPISTPSWGEAPSTSPPEATGAAGASQLAPMRAHLLPSVNEFTVTCQSGPGRTGARVARS
jgi:hypothetical protein